MDNITETLNYHGLEGQRIVVPDISSTLIGMSSLFLVAAALAVAARFYTRKKIARESFRPDDWLISAAMIGYASRILYIIAVGLTKISVLAFLAHLNPYNSIALCIKVLIIAISAFIVVGVFCLILQCIPISDAFILANILEKTRIARSCMDLNALSWSIPVVNTFLDFLVWTLPVKIIWHVRATLRQKLAMVTLMCLGLIACIASGMRIYYLSRLRKDVDPTWLIVDVNIWIAAEISIAIICTCCPALKQLFQHHFIKPTPAIQQPPSEGSINLDPIPFQQPPLAYGNYRCTSLTERIDDFMHDSFQSSNGSIPSSQLKSLREMAGFANGSCSATSDVGNQGGEGDRRNSICEV
ncbi:hypothetical protein RUND412_005995 [Rhizina undulata]